MLRKLHYLLFLTSLFATTHYQTGQDLCIVTRWANPVSTGLKSEDWVMYGGRNFKNWALSGKMNPLRPKYHIPYNLGRSFPILKKSLKYPNGWEKFKGLPPWNQRQIR